MVTWCCCCFDRRSNSTQPTGLGKQRSSRLVDLHGIMVHGQNGTVYDLSSAFKPEVDEYGASVPPAFVNGSLCILPGNGGAAPPPLQGVSLPQILTQSSATANLSCPFQHAIRLWFLKSCCSSVWA